MQPEWRNQLYKAANLVVSVPPGHPAWPEDMYEPLTLAFVVHFIKHRPWQLRGSSYLLAMGRELSLLWKDDAGGGGSILQQFWGAQRFISSLSEELAREVLYSEKFIGVPNSMSGKRRMS